MKIAMLYPNLPAFGPQDHANAGLGGSESSFVRTVEHLVAKGHTVHVFNRWPGEMYEGNLAWRYLAAFNRQEPYDVVYALRHADMFDEPVNAKLRVLFLADTESYGLGERVRQGKINLVMAVSHWQKEKIALEEKIADEHWLVTSGGIDVGEGGWVAKAAQQVDGRCLYAATPDRGLRNVLEIWPKIKQQVPWASLHIYSSYLGWGITANDNEQRLISEYSLANDYAALDVVNHRHASAAQIRQAEMAAQVYLYPSNFYETCCMCVLESMYCGTIPVVSGRAALLEKVVDGVTGFLVPTYTAETERYRNLFIDKTVKALTLSSAERQLITTNAYRYARQFTYDLLIEQWLQEWQRRLS